MKKILLGLGSITAIAAPIAAVVSCGDKTQYVTTPAVDADGTTHNYLSDAQALVMKDLLHRVYPTVKADDIKAVELLKDGYSLNTGATSADSDYAIRFVFNKTVAIELGDYNKIMRENGELIFSAYSVNGRVTSIVKNPNAPFTQHEVIGAAKDMVVAALNANDMKFIVPAPVVTETHTAEVQHYDFSADIAKFNTLLGQNQEVASTKHGEFFVLPLSTSSADLTTEFLGIPNVELSDGVHLAIQLKANVEGKFSATATLTKGEDSTEIEFVIAPATGFNFTSYLSKIVEDYHSTKTLEVIMAGVTSPEVTQDQVAIMLPNFSDGVTASIRIVIGDSGAVTREDGAIALDITLTKGEDHATKRAWLIPLAEAIPSGQDADMFSGPPPMGR